MPVINAAPSTTPTPSPSTQKPTTPTSLLPPINYGSRDYASVVNDLIANIPGYMPEWTSRSPSDFGIVLLQMFAWVCDILNYYEDRIANEAFLATATQLQSVLSIAEMLDYQPQGAIGASVLLNLTAAAGQPVTFPPNAIVQFSTLGTATQAPIIFEYVAPSTGLTIAGGTTTSVTAVQGITHSDEQVANSDGTANQVYGLAASPMIANSLSVYVDEGYGPQLWQYTEHLIDYGPQDAVYSTYTDANGATNIEFGDNANGRIPALGAPITATYRVGIGSLGNVGQNTVVQTVAPTPGLSVTNPAAATGGADPESINSIQRQAPASLKAADRAVTLNDYISLALQVPGVLHAAAQAATYQLVSLYVAPYGGGGPPQSIVTSLQNYLATRTPAGTTVRILSPSYVPVDITVTVNIWPQFQITPVKNAVVNALFSLLNLNNVGFGTRISVGAIYAAIMSVPGVQNPSASLIARHDMNPVPNGVQDAVMGVSEIPTAGTITVNTTGGVPGT